MNKNTKARFAVARKNYCKNNPSTSFNVPMKVAGNRGSGYNFRTQTITIGYLEPRRGKKAKVAAKSYSQGNVGGN